MNECVFDVRLFVYSYFHNSFVVKFFWERHTQRCPQLRSIIDPIHWSDIGQVAQLSQTQWGTSQKSDITRRTLEVDRWQWPECWSNNVANSHLKLGRFNHRVLRSCLVWQCSHLPHWPCQQQRFANCDRMALSCTSRQPSYHRRHPTCWASSQWSQTVPSTPFHGAWIPAPLSAHLSTEW